MKAHGQQPKHVACTYVTAIASVSKVETQHAHWETNTANGLRGCREAQVLWCKYVSAAGNRKNHVWVQHMYNACGKKSHYSVQIRVKEQVKITTYLQTAVHSRYG